MCILATELNTLLSWLPAHVFLGPPAGSSYLKWIPKAKEGRKDHIVCLIAAYALERKPCSLEISKEMMQEDLQRSFKLES